jgi:hypothetical protein
MLKYIVSIVKINNKNYTLFKFTFITNCTYLKNSNNIEVLVN